MNKDIVVPSDITLMSALKRMDEISRKLLVLAEGKTFKGVLSIGDIQRAIINKIDLESLASDVVRKIITVGSVHDSREHIKQQMLSLRTECMPIVNDEGELTEIIFWEDIIDTVGASSLPPMDTPVIIMAGGKGTRLKPLTNVIPKPLIPVGDKTMLETIIESFQRHNCKEFYLSVNYKAELIEYYLENNAPKDISISYFQETTPLGTAGSLHLLKDKIDSTFFVTNCDIIVDQDYSEILEYHKKNNNELTVVAVLKHISIPYGTIETGPSGILESIKEKPELTYMINSGLYILEPHLIDEIPTNEFYHITYLINELSTLR